MHLLLTRPEPDNARTSAQLEAVGHRVSRAPLMTIIPLAQPDFSQEADGYIVTSASVFKALERALILPDMLSKPLWAVGAHTASAARDSGFRDIRQGPGDARGLAAQMAIAIPARARLIHLAGENRAHDFAALLPHCRVATHIIYRAEAATVLPDDIVTALGAGGIDGVLHYSPRSARLLCELCLLHGVANALKTAVSFCISPATADMLQGYTQHIHVAEQPNEKALMHTISAFQNSTTYC
jgi:uroporphyrinogen-III synthase